MGSGYGDPVPQTAHWTRARLFRQEPLGSGPSCCLWCWDQLDLIALARAQIVSWPVVAAAINQRACEPSSASSGASGTAFDAFLAV